MPANGSSPYPYRIPSVTDAEIYLRKLGYLEGESRIKIPDVLKRLPHVAVEFLLEVEALMRSEKVIGKFKRGLIRKNEPLAEYFIHDDVLKGEHFTEYVIAASSIELSTRKREDTPPSPVVVNLEDEPYLREGKLQVIIKCQSGTRKPSAFTLTSPDLITNIEARDPEDLYLRVKAGTRSAAVLKQLRPILKARHQMAMSARAKAFLKTNRFDLARWLDYFQCYDLRKLGLAYGKIAQKV